MAELLYKDEVYAIIGAAMDVYNQLGPGFGEAIYQEALEIEIENRKIPNNPQQDTFIFYKGQRLKNFFTPDLICYEKIVVEIKYLKATNMPVGLLINFGSEKDLERKRMVLTSQKPTQAPKVIPPSLSPRINDPKPISED